MDKSVATLGASRRTHAWAACQPLVALNLLHRYLFREVLFATLVAVALFALVLLSGIAVHDLVVRTAAGQLTVEETGQMVLLAVPSVMTYAFPFGLLTAVLLVLGRVSAQHEITAMRCAGMGLLRISAPVLAIAVLGVAMCLVLNFEYAPQTKLRYRELLFEVGQTNPESLVVPGTFVRDFPGVVVYVGSRDGPILNDVWVWTVDEEHRVTSSTWVERAEIRVDQTAETISILARGQVRGERRDEKHPEDFSKPPQPVFFDAQRPVWEAKLGEIFKRKVFVPKVAWMDFGELMAERRRLRGSEKPEDRARYLEVQMNLHEKGALAFSVLSFAFVAVPLGIQTRRKETSANLGLALGMILAYYFGLTAVGWLTRRPDLRPDLLLWAPNLVFQMLAGWMWWRFGKN